MDKQSAQQEGEETARLLWTYHDWLHARGYVLCQRAARSRDEPHAARLSPPASYWPVRDGAALIARFLAWMAEHEQDKKEQDGGADG